MGIVCGALMGGMIGASPGLLRLGGLGHLENPPIAIHGDDAMFPRVEGSELRRTPSIIRRRPESGSTKATRLLSREYRSASNAAAWSRTKVAPERPV